MSEPGLEVILTHEHTDFDALASLLAASLLFVDALPVLPAQLNRNVRDFVALYKNQFPFLQARELPRQPIKRLILVDTRTANWPKRVADDATYYVIDHHSFDVPAPEFGQGSGEVTFWTEQVGANTTMLVEKLQQQQFELSPVQATLLALGIHEDTGSLTYASTTVRDARCLAWLMEPEQGVNLEVLHQYLRHPLSESQRTLLETLIDQSTFLPIAGHTVVIAQADAPEFSDELSTLAHRLRDVHEADAILLVVGLDEIVQVVARSVSDDIDVGAVARHLGGGGHARAAAAPVRHANVADVVERIKTLLTNTTRPAVTVRHIMTSGRPQMLAPDLTIEAAHLLMRRYGHEGFPVVAHTSDGRERLLGVLTRREADRALNHGMGEQPVRRFMQAGPHNRPVTVRPEDSIASLRKLMIESGWGQVPVVDEAGQIIGIVTRTDLIKLWDESAPPERHADEIDRRLRTTLAPAQLELLRFIGHEVDQMDFSVFVVGGFVRDLMLNNGRAQLSALDMDIVIEGDAPEFARRVQSLYGGRVVTHKRFGTAKWILDDPAQPVNWPALFGTVASVTATVATNLPSHLDFVTARTEFYTAPTALPTVELSNIKLDLHRRDFTINTLAFSLNPDRWGELLDFYGGLNDLRSGVIRVLHSLSFVDDPTRILRAVRYEQRFDFRIEPRTIELLKDAADLLDRVTPARIRHELERILEEDAPERALRRLAELGILTHIDPQLTADDWVTEQFVRLRSRLQQPDVDQRLAQESRDRLYWGILTMRLPAEVQSALQTRLGLRSSTQQLMNGLRRLHSAAARLGEPGIKPSAVVALLDKVDDTALALYGLLSKDALVEERLRQYWRVWRHVRPILTGEDLQALGIPRGPLYSEILSQLRTARLDGTAHTRGEEIAIVKALVANKNATSSDS